MTGAWSESELGVFDRLQSALEDDREAVLVTITDVEGNAYRRPGAKMVVDGGEGVGHITAGCLEDEVLDLAESVLAEGRPRLETFDLMEDDDVWGLGMGCHGIIDVLLEPVDERLRPVVESYRAGEPVCPVTVLNSRFDDVPAFARAHYSGGSERWLANDGSTDLRIDDGHALLADLEERAGDALADGRSHTTTLETDDGTAEVFLDGVRPPPELVVVGTGPDVDPVVEMARRNEFRVTVVGYRGGDVDPDRFSAADVRTTSPRSLRSSVDFDEETYVVVMTHNYVDDLLTLEQLLETSVPYVALVGAQERVERMFDELQEEGTSLAASDRERIYAPAGLDLGGGSPNQIATSIVGELLAVHNDRAPRHLRERKGPIHERTGSSLDQ